MGLDNPIHIAFLLIVLLLVFGAKRLPEMGKSLGSGMRGFKDAISGEDAHPSVQTAPRVPAEAVVPVALATQVAPTPPATPTQAAPTHVVAAPADERVTA